MTAVLFLGWVAMGTAMLAGGAQAQAWKPALDARMVEHLYIDSREARRVMEQQYGELKAILAELGLTRQ
jgi:hypothetical protein